MEEIREIRKREFQICCPVCGKHRFNMEEGKTSFQCEKCRAYVVAIVKDKIECDLFDWLEKKQNSQYHYIGDYMNQYSWPEYTHAELDEINYALEDEGY